MTRIFENIELSLGPHLQMSLEEFQAMDTAVGTSTSVGGGCSLILWRPRPSAPNPVPWLEY
jgi:hypothetical protein